MGDAFISNDQITARVPSFDGDRDMLWEHFTKAVPSPPARAHKKLTPRQNRIFYGICNRSDPEKDGFKGDFRDVHLSTKGPTINELLETDSLAHILRARCSIDIQPSQIPAFHRLEFDTYSAFNDSATSPNRIYMTDSGGRFLGTLPHC